MTTSTACPGSTWALFTGLVIVAVGLTASRTWRVRLAGVLRLFTLSRVTDWTVTLLVAMTVVGIVTLKVVINGFWPIGTVSVRLWLGTPTVEKRAEVTTWVKATSSLAVTTKLSVCPGPTDVAPERLARVTVGG